jgi:hypothetical protein
VSLQRPCGFMADGKGRLPRRIEARLLWSLFTGGLS